MTTTQVRPGQRTRRTPLRGDAVVGLVAAVAAVGVWSFWTQLAGVDLVVRQGDRTQEVGVGAVLVTVLVVSLLGVGLLRMLERRPTGLRGWTITAGVVFVLSLLGPLGAESVAAGLVLAMLHTVVAVVLVVGLRQLRLPVRHAGSTAAPGGVA